MKKYFALLLVVFMSQLAWAGRGSFGGSRSSGYSGSRSSSYSRPSSSFGGYRSGAATRSAPAPIIRPSAPSRSSSYSSSPSVNHTTIVNNNSGGGGYGSSMLNWMMFWHVMSPQPQQPVVVVEGAVGTPVAQAQAVVSGPVVAATAQESSHWFLWTLLIGVIVIIGYLMIQGRKNEGVL